eukprot:UN32248
MILVPTRMANIFSFYIHTTFQILIILTGNYNWFNLHTIVLCITLLDDEHLELLNNIIFCGCRTTKNNSVPEVKKK